MGIGGLGCVVSEILVRLGVGKLVIADNGIVEESNLGRQSLYCVEDLDKKKTEVAKSKLEKMTGCTSIEEYFFDVRSKETKKIIHSVHGIADCLDNYESRFALENYLYDNQFLVHGGVERDFGQITTIVKNKTLKLSDIYYNIKIYNETIAVSPISVFAIGSLMAQEVMNNIIGTPMLINKLFIVELSDFSFTTLELK